MRTTSSNTGTPASGRQSTSPHPRRRKRSVPWIVVSVAPLPRSRLQVKFVDGTRGEVDLRALLARRDVGVFAPLRSRAEFVQVRLEEGVVVWPCGVDLAPDVMYDQIRAAGVYIVGAGRSARPFSESESESGRRSRHSRRPRVRTQALPVAPEDPPMPTISVFYGIIIRMYWDEHGPPHFHATYARESASISIQDLRVLAGGLPLRAMKLVRRWGNEHRRELIADWELCRRGVAPKAIEPLE